MPKYLKDIKDPTKYYAFSVIKCKQGLYKDSSTAFISTSLKKLTC